MISNFVSALISKGIRPSPQRVALLAAITPRKDHPTAEMLFEELRPSMPTLSKTTVLSTMRLLRNAGLVRDVRAEEGELRFDANCDFHAHFKCRACGALSDIFLENIHSRPYVDLPEGFEIDDEQLIYYGLCPECSTTQKKG